MSIDRFLVAVESHDLSQADKSIIRVPSFPKLFINDKIYSYTKKNYLALGNECFGESYHSKIALGKKTLLLCFCQLEIDHVTQQPKETCQRTCRGPE